MTRGDGTTGRWVSRALSRGGRIRECHVDGDFYRGQAVVVVEWQWRVAAHSPADTQRTFCPLSLCLSFSLFVDLSLLRRISGLPSSRVIWNFLCTRGLEGSRGHDAYLYMYILRVLGYYWHTFFSTTMIIWTRWRRFNWRLDSLIF